MRSAIEQRRNAGGSNGPFFVEEAQAQHLSELPAQLKPNPNGLTEAQFQVYEDFSRLNTIQKPRDPATDNRGASATAEVSISDIDSILKQLDRQQSLDDVLKYQLTQKLKLLS